MLIKPDVLLTSTVPVAVFILGVAAGLEVMSYRMLLVMSVISFGVLVASYGEIDINWIGVVYQMGGVVAEALRLIFMEILVKRKGRKLNPISIMYYVSPCRCVINSLKLYNIFFHCMLKRLVVFVHANQICKFFVVLSACSSHGFFWRCQRWMLRGHGVFNLSCSRSTLSVLLL